MTKNILETKGTQAKPYQGLAWLFTATLIGAATMAAFNLYPWYSYAFTVSNLGWVLVGYLWKEKSLIVLNAGLTIIYIIGLAVDGTKLVSLIPFVAFLYSSIVGILPKIVDNTTTGVEDRRDSPFFSSESSTTLPLNNLVDVAITVSPLSAFS